ncbi:MAG: carotenoid oxygenase family protein [Pseudomonadota bacterium]|nr:carotenoid oxygenase family protein [Pseudomonadota bacterium]
MNAASLAEGNVNALNPYVQGFYAPQLEEVTATDLDVIGELPTDLWGAYVRNGPNPFKIPDVPHHWFDGEGMVHSIYFENGKAEYRNRYVLSDDNVADMKGSGADARGVLVPANRDRPDKVYKDTANTDLVMHNGQLMALWYISGTPVRLNARTLETVGNEDFGGKLPRNVSAHGKVDPETGEFLFFDYSLYEPWMSFGVVSADNELTHFAKIDLPGPRLPHDMGFTENYVILHDLPVVFTDSGIRNGMWQIRTEQRGARFGVVPRNGTAKDVKWFETDPCYLYHVANSWEEGDEVVMVACRMTPNNFKPNPAHGQFGGMVNILALHAYAWEWRMNMKTGAITSRQLDDRLSEFPAINQAYAGRKTRWSYHVAMANEDLQRFEGLIKYDLETGAREEYLFGDQLGGSEPVFAPRADAKDEDDGYVITYVTHIESGASEVLILDAKKFSEGPIARIPLPARVPAGFHATWADGDKITA